MKRDITQKQSSGIASQQSRDMRRDKATWAGCIEMAMAYHKTTQKQSSGIAGQQSREMRRHKTDWVRCTKKAMAYHKTTQKP